jgi:hypothetical protein
MGVGFDRRGEASGKQRDHVWGGNGRAGDFALVIFVSVAVAQDEPMTI